MENNERMSRDSEKPSEFDASTGNLRSTFEQLSPDRINDECNKNLAMLKSLETIIQERIQSFAVFLASQSKIKTSFDVFRYTKGTLRQAFDALFVFTEQEMQQARQESTLEELRSAVMQCRVDAQRKMNEYQQQVLASEREVTLGEKRLKKSKSALNRLLEQKDKLIYSDGKEDSPSKTPAWKQYVLGGINNIVNHANPVGTPVATAEMKGKEVDRLQDCVNNIIKCKETIRGEIRTLLSVISSRDQIYLANRKALQSLDRECKHMVVIALKALTRREAESSTARSSVLEKFQTAVNSIDSEVDETDFIETYKNDADGVFLSSQALSMINDIDIGVNMGHEDEESRTRASSSSPTTIMSAAGVDYEALMGEWLSAIFSADASLCTLRLLPEKMAEHCQATVGGSVDSGSSLEHMVCRIVDKTGSQVGRNAFVMALNKFRSRQVDVGPGYYYLAAAVWGMLQHCRNYTDVRSAKIVMMLSQVQNLLQI